MQQEKLGSLLSKTELAAVNLLIAHLEEANRARMESDGFIDSIASVVSAAANAVTAAASVAAVGVARAAIGAGTAVTNAATAAGAAVADAATAAGAAVANAAANPAIASAAEDAAVATLAIGSSSISMLALIAKLNSGDVESALSLDNLITLRNQCMK
jgi:hypothetical protein